MPNFQLPPPLPVRVQAEALRTAFPTYYVNVIMKRGDKPRFEVVSRDGGSPYCLISTDAKEIWAELKAALGQRHSYGPLAACAGEVATEYPARAILAGAGGQRGWCTKRRPERQHWSGRVHALGTCPFSISTCPGTPHRRKPVQPPWRRM
jgi:hypothetical protein